MSQKETIFLNIFIDLKLFIKLYFRMLSLKINYSTDQKKIPYFWNTFCPEHGKYMQKHKICMFCLKFSELYSVPYLKLSQNCFNQIKSYFTSDKIYIIKNLFEKIYFGSFKLNQILKFHRLN